MARIHSEVDLEGADVEEAAVVETVVDIADFCIGKELDASNV